MKRASKIALIVSGGCLLMGVGGIAAPSLRETFIANTPAVKEEPLPSLTTISSPDTNAPRFTVQRLNTTVSADLVQAVGMNNRGEILCVAENHEPYQVPPRNGRPAITRYRTTNLRFMIYREGETHLILESKGINTFRPLAINDLGQVLGIQYDLKEPPKTESATTPNFSNGPVYTNSISMPSPRNSRLVLWDKDKFQNLDVLPALLKAGMPARFQYFLDSATILFNKDTQVLVGLQSLFLWNKGVARRLGSTGGGISDRIFLNNQGTIVRRGDEYRTGPDGTSFYPLYALSIAGKPTPDMLDFGFGTYVFDLNDRNELLLGRMFMPSPDAPRTRIAVWNAGKTVDSFAVNGRTVARFNQKGMILAWRQTDGGMDWRALFSGGSGLNSASVPVLWYRGKLYDVDTLLPDGAHLVSIIDLNDRGEILGQVRWQSKAETVLLSPRFSDNS